MERTAVPSRAHNTARLWSVLAAIVALVAPLVMATSPVTADAQPAQSTATSDQGVSTPQPSALSESSTLGADPIEVQVSAGDSHICGVHADGMLTCWGANNYGQATPPSGTFKRISAGSDHTCAIRSDDTVACWGRDMDGQSTPPSGEFKSISARGIAHLRSP